MIRSSWTGFSWKVAMTPFSPRSAPATTKCSANRVFPIPDGPAMTVAAPRQ